ncbi:chromate transporter [Natranaerovirga pectinivora]|uniref:Chromate transporter n=1 Tax=Natranaerovirga pectinivora TaxID=682400 RepID=A0A4R3MKY2_9FIRM|nr:chromate transporter [Natranaerovirga pectinivora]TCT14616.1 chromate transporter [Natranaerovirga pectinivora]
MNKLKKGYVATIQLLKKLLESFKGFFNNDVKKLFEIYKSFFIVGLLTIGGGIAMLPIIEKELIEKKKWCTDDEILESYSVAQSLPGVIASNTAVFVGHKLKGILGSIFAVLGVISPSIIIILIVATVFTRLNDYIIVQNAFKGIRAAVLALLVTAIYRMIKNAIVDYYTIIIAGISFVLVMGSFVSPMLIIVAASLVGILIYYRRIKG